MPVEDLLLQMGLAYHMHSDIFESSRDKFQQPSVSKSFAPAAEKARRARSRKELWVMLELSDAGALASRRRSTSRRIGPDALKKLQALAGT